MPKIIEIEKGKDWQATAEDKNQHLLAIVRAEHGTYYVYDGNWTANAYASSIQYPNGRPAHTAEEIKSMFASGELKLIKGSIPK